MPKIDEAYRYQIVRAAALQSAAEATTVRACRTALALAAFSQRSARLIGAVA